MSPRDRPVEERSLAADGVAVVASFADAVKAQPARQMGPGLARSRWRLLGCPNERRALGTVDKTSPTDGSSTATTSSPLSPWRRAVAGHFQQRVQRASGAVPELRFKRVADRVDDDQNRRLPDDAEGEPLQSRQR
jgi:hypothetical protein